MKEKTSITLSTDLIKALDRATGRGGNRSAYIEAVLRKHFRKLAKRDEDALEVERLNRLAAKLKAEHEDALNYQADL